MNLRAHLAVAALITAAHATEPRPRSDSSSRQFTVYCEDTALRQRVVSFAEEVKADVLGLLGESDAWKSPIVITLDRARGPQPAVLVRPVKTDGGFKVEIAVKIGDDPAAVNLQKHIVRALLLEYAYRQEGVQPGEHYVEAPWWVVEGALQIFRRRELGVDAPLFQRLLAANQLPAIEDFLTEKPAELGPTAFAFDQACAMALLALLLEQPGGRERLARLLRDWPRGNGDPSAALAAAFPSVGKGHALQKWWTLSLARAAASDRYEGMSVERTDRELSTQTRLDLATGKAGEHRLFRLEDWREFAKLPASRPALRARQSTLVALSARANALLRPVIAEYEQIVSLLARGKTRGMQERIAQAASHRASLLHRLSDIEDYMNWFEATQMGMRSAAFEGFLKTVHEISEQDRRASDSVSRYLDQFEGEL